MKLALINGSPRTKDSSSQIFLQEIHKRLPEAHTIDFVFRSPQIDQGEAEKLLSCDALVFAFPLYVDGIPSQLLSCLRSLESVCVSGGHTLLPRVFALVNCGFFEAHQCTNALEQMKLWSLRARLPWGLGLAVGGGAMMPMLKSAPDDKGMKKPISAALNTLASAINTAQQTDTQPTGADLIFTAPAFPRFLYKLAAEFGWKQAARQNGIKPRDLWKKINYEETRR